VFVVLQIVLWTVLKLLLAALGFLYVGLVLMVYRTEGPRFRLRVNRQDPFRSAQQLFIWLGVRALAAIVRVGSSAWEMLSDASADLGEWYVRRRSGETRPSFHSHFL
jgi:hypothetical protein